jgi:hypothetical protein
MRAAVTQLWQQKQPTPSSRQWGFHWHPADLPASLTEALSRLDVGLVGAGAVAFVVGDDFVAWARSFSARAPSEQRAYVGLAGAVCRPVDPTHAPAALAALAELLPDAGPHAVDRAPRPVTLSPRPLTDPAPMDRETALALARMIWRGDRAQVPVLPDAREIATLLGWLPPGDRVGRRGVITVGAPLAAGRADPIVHYLARFWSQAGSRPTWQLLLDAAARAGEPFADFFAGLERVAAAWDAPGSLVRFLSEVIAPDELARTPAPLLVTDVADAGELWARVLHHWGRGFLSDGTRDRLAALGARRVLVDHLVAVDEARPDLAERYLRRLRYESLLTHAKVDEMLTAMRHTAPGLGA